MSPVLVLLTLFMAVQSDRILPRSDFWWKCRAGTSTFLCLDDWSGNVTLVPDNNSQFYLWPYRNEWNQTCGLSTYVEAIYNYEPVNYLFQVVTRNYEAMEVGMYNNASSWDYAHHPGMNFTKNHNSIGLLENVGNYRVNDFKVDRYGNLTRLALDWNYTTTIPFEYNTKGKLRYRSVYGFCDRFNESPRSRSVFCYKSEYGDPMGNGWSDSMVLPTNSSQSWAWLGWNSMTVSFPWNWTITAKPKGGDYFQNWTVYDHTFSAKWQYTELLPYLSISHNSTRCDKEFGMFNLMNVERNWYGDLMKFDFTLEHHCNSTDGPGFYAYYRYINETANYTDTDDVLDYLEQPEEKMTLKTLLETLLKN